MAKIDHVAAHDGGIECFAGLGNKVGYAKTAEALAQIFAQHGLAQVCSASSSVDFCSEYGFPVVDGHCLIAHRMCASVVWETVLTAKINGA